MNRKRNATKKVNGISHTQQSRLQGVLEGDRISDVGCGVAVMMTLIARMFPNRSITEASLMEVAKPFHETGSGIIGEFFSQMAEIMGLQRMDVHFNSSLTPSKLVKLLKGKAGGVITMYRKDKNGKLTGAHYVALMRVSDTQVAISDPLDTSPEVMSYDDLLVIMRDNGANLMILRPTSLMGANSWKWFSPKHSKKAIIQGDFMSDNDANYGVNHNPLAPKIKAIGTKAMAKLKDMKIDKPIKWVGNKLSGFKPTKKNLIKYAAITAGLAAVGVNPIFAAPLYWATKKAVKGLGKASSWLVKGTVRALAKPMKALGGLGLDAIRGIGSVPGRLAHSTTKFLDDKVLKRQGWMGEQLHRDRLTLDDKADNRENFKFTRRWGKEAIDDITENSTILKGGRWVNGKMNKAIDGMFDDHNALNYSDTKVTHVDEPKGIVAKLKDKINNSNIKELMSTGIDISNTHLQRSVEIALETKDTLMDNLSVAKESNEFVRSSMERVTSIKDILSGAAGKSLTVTINGGHLGSVGAVAAIDADLAEDISKDTRADMKAKGVKSVTKLSHNLAADDVANKRQDIEAKLRVLELEDELKENEEGANGKDGNGNEQDEGRGNILTNWKSLITKVGGGIATIKAAMV